MMIIKEIWAISEQEDEEPKAVPLNVISIGTKSIFYEDKRIGEVVSALVYDPEDGKISELPLELCYIKTLQDDKDKTAQPITFGAPGITTTGREGR